EQKESEMKIRRLTDRVLLATQISNVGVWEYDAFNDQLIWEEQMYAIFSDFDHPATFHELKGIVLPEYLDNFNKIVDKVKNGLSFFEIDLGVTIDSEVKFIRNFCRVINGKQDERQGIVGVVYDVTNDRKIRADLEASLDEKDVLIREVHHRVKNNLQLISSIVALKSFEIKDEEVKALFEDVNLRIKAMAVIHDKLYTFSNVSQIDISEYLQHVVEELEILLARRSIDFIVDAKNYPFDVDKALLIGLIVSELVSNAVKHGFDHDQKGSVLIGLKAQENYKLLYVSSSGKSLPLDILDRKNGLGISLIKTFSKQLNGEIKISEEMGFTIEFF
ncbi:MAG: histidine kinase dimerization/phosphoacceptor domain -containing protein, partial [Bacteroidota bacterium]